MGVLAASVGFAAGKQARLERWNGQMQCFGSHDVDWTAVEVDFKNVERKGWYEPWKGKFNTV